MLFIVNKLLAPLAPIFLILCLILAASTYGLYQARNNSMKDLHRLQDIVSRQNTVIDYTRNEKIRLETVLTKTQAAKTQIIQQSCTSLNTLEKLSSIKKVKSTSISTTEVKPEVDDYEVLNMQLGAVTISLLNDAASSVSN